MSYHRLGAVLPLSLLVAPAVAQVTATAVVDSASLTVQVAGAQPLTVSTVSGTAVPAPLSASLFARPNFVRATLDNDLVSTASGISLTTRELVSLQEASSVSYRSELLLQVSATQPVPVAVELEWNLALLTSASPLPLVEVDIDNDGTIDLSGMPNRTVRLATRLSGSRQFLLRSAASAASSAGLTYLSQYVDLRVVPDHPDVLVSPIVTPCRNLTLDVGQTFRRGVEIGGSLSGYPTVIGLPFLVLGFSPVLTPLPTTPVCFLLPRPDIAVPFPAAPVSLDAAALGPQQFFVQGVLLSTVPALSMLTTNGAFVRF